MSSEASEALRFSRTRAQYSTKTKLQKLMARAERLQLFSSYGEVEVQIW